MLPVKKPDSRVVYVAGSAREFPEPVLDWLSQTKNRAIASTNVYEALARLTGRYRPCAMIISIDSVDWDELDFFDLAARLSPQTTLYVTAHEYNQAKLEAALQRGAKLFDDVDLDADLARPVTSTQQTTQNLFAGTLPFDYDRPASRFGTDVAQDRRIAAISGPTPAQSVQEPVAEPSKEDRDDLARKESPPAAAQQRETSPAMRLVLPHEAESEMTRVSEPEVPIPFPWSPSPDRPKRIPPSAGRTKPESQPANQQEHQFDSESKSDSESGNDLDNRLNSGPDLPTRPPTTHINDPPSVELTSEELAALMGRTVPPSSDPDQEQRS